MLFFEKPFHQLGRISTPASKVDPGDFREMGGWAGLLHQEQNKDAVNGVNRKNGEDDYRQRVSMRVRVRKRQPDQK